MSATRQSNACIDLETIVVCPSNYLWRAQLVIYCAMLVAIFMALLPFFFAAYYWILLWLMCVFLIGVAIFRSWQVKNAAPLRFAIKQNNWHLTTIGGDFLVIPNKEVLLWSWVIVIPLREVLTPKSHYLVILPDSVAKEDWRRLRVWLATCL